MIKGLVKLALVVGVAAALVNSLPDIARYLKLKEM